MSLISPFFFFNSSLRQRVFLTPCAFSCRVEEFLRIFSKNLMCEYFLCMLTCILLNIKVNLIFNTIIILPLVPTQLEYHFYSTSLKCLSVYLFFEFFFKIKYSKKSKYF